MARGQLHLDRARAAARRTCELLQPHLKAYDEPQYSVVRASLLPDCHLSSEPALAGKSVAYELGASSFIRYAAMYRYFEAYLINCMLL